MSAPDWLRAGTNFRFLAVISAWLTTWPTATFTQAVPLKNCKLPAAGSEVMVTDRLVLPSASVTLKSLQANT
ncbi:hypothetical protein D9M71_256370 [compost metagenome]